MGDDEKFYVWHVEGSEPPTEKRRWAKNVKITVFAGSLERAADLTLKARPGITLHKVLRDRDADLILDGAALEEADA